VTCNDRRLQIPRKRATPQTARTSRLPCLLSLEARGHLGPPPSPLSLTQRVASEHTYIDGSTLTHAAPPVCNQEALLRPLDIFAPSAPANCWIPHFTCSPSCLMAQLLDATVRGLTFGLGLRDMCVIKLASEQTAGIQTINIIYMISQYLFFPILNRPSLPFNRLIADTIVTSGAIFEAVLKHACFLGIEHRYAASVDCFQ
jgi:hypothetical protein